MAQNSSKNSGGRVLEDDVFKVLQALVIVFGGILIFPSLLTYKFLKSKPSSIFEKDEARRKLEGISLLTFGLVVFTLAYLVISADHPIFRLGFFSLGVNCFLMGGMWAGMNSILYGVGSGDRLRVEDLKKKVRDFSPVSSLYEDSKHSAKDTAVVIGISPKTQKLIRISRRSRTMHCLFPGASGFGKTTLLKVFLVNSIVNREPTVIIDAKGSQSNLEEFRKFLGDKGFPKEKFFVFSLTAPSESDCYNPIANGTMDEKRDRLINALNWSEVYYRDQAVAYLTELFPVLDFYKQGQVTLSDIRGFMNDSEYRIQLQASLKEIFENELCPKDLADRISDITSKIKTLNAWNKDAVSGLSGQLIAIDKESFRTLLNPPGSERTIAEIFKEYQDRRSGASDGKKNKKQKSDKVPSNVEVANTQETEFLRTLRLRPSASSLPRVKLREIDLKKGMEQRDIIYFQLSTLAVTDSARRIGKMILEDLKWITAEINAHKVEKPEFFPVYIDEFGEFASTEFPVFLEQAREAKIGIHMFFQGVGNLKSISEDFPERMYDSTCVKGFMSTSSQIGADTFSSMTGTVDTLENSRQILDTPFLKIATGMGNQRETKQMRVEHDVFKQLGPGQMVIVDKLPEFHVELVQVWNPSEEKRVLQNVPKRWEVKRLEVQTSQTMLCNESKESLHL